MATHGNIRNPELRGIIKAEGAHCISFMPIAADADWFKTTVAPTAGENKVTTLAAASMTKAYCPGWPVVPVTVVLDDAGDDWTAVSVAYSGVDQFGDYITDTATGTNSSGTWTATGVKAFQAFTSIAITVTGTATSSDSYTIGFAKTYGIGRRIGASGEIIAQLFDGAADVGTVSVANQTIVIAGTPDAAKNWLVFARPEYYIQ